MYFQGLLIGLFSFLIIGLFHPIVIKGEYYWGKQIWPIFLITGCLTLLISLWIANLFYSSLLAIFSFSCFWSIHEIYEQEKRVKRGWFPANPKRKSNRLTHKKPK